MEQWFEVKGTCLVIRLPAEVDHHNAAIICADADRILKRRMIRSIVFDFGRTVFMDSSGIGMMMGRYKMMRFLGGDVAAVRVNERMKKILRLSGIDKIIDIREETPQPAGREQ